MVVQVIFAVHIIEIIMTKGAECYAVSESISATMPSRNNVMRLKEWFSVSERVRNSAGAILAFFIIPLKNLFSPGSVFEYLTLCVFQFSFRIIGQFTLFMHKTNKKKQV